MNDATKAVARGWGFDNLDEIEETLHEDVDLGVLTLLLVIDMNHHLQHNERKLDKIMADLSALEEAVANLTNVEENVLAAVTTLKEEVSTLEAGSISQEKIDSITSAVTGVATALGSAVAPAETPPAEETPAEPPAEETPAPPAEETPPAA